MSETVAKRGRTAPAVLPELTTEQVTLIKQTCCKGPPARPATDDELALFLSTCRRRGLDPLARQICAVWRKDWETGKQVMTIQTQIDGYRLIAERTGELGGQDGPHWTDGRSCPSCQGVGTVGSLRCPTCEGEGIRWVSAWFGKESPAAARVRVYRKGADRPWTGVAHWAEYAGSGPFWKPPRGAAQLAKCAEALALRKAFPEELSGMYTIEEMSDEEPAPPALSRPAEPAAPALAAPKETPPALPVATPEQLAEMLSLKKQLQMSQDAWFASMRKRGVESAKDLTPQQADEVIAALKARLAQKSQTLQEAMADIGPDGLTTRPNQQEAGAASPNGFQRANG